MKASTFAKAGVSVSAAAALTLGLCSGSYAAGPTATDEDPTVAPTASTLVGVGSDTTQDVMYGIAKAINTAAGSQVIASYTATGGTTIKYRSGSTATRPNGSGAGYTALKDAIGVTANTTTSKVAVGDVDFARASGKQGTAASGSTGVSTDVPFAVDAMSVAVPANSPFLKTNGGSGLSISDLRDIYAGTKTYINKATGALVDTATGSADTATYEPINAFVPKSGSGSRQFFLQQLATQTGIDLTANGSTKGDGLWNNAGKPTGSAPYVGAETYTADPANAGHGTPVQEHDATVLTSAPATVAAIAPFSGAKFIGYHNGTIADPDANRTAGSDYVLVPFKSSVAGAPGTGVLPYTGTTTLAPNTDYVTYGKQGSETAFALTRDVYNIIPTAAWKNPTANAKYALINKTFVGAGSDVCKQTAVIAQYGFLPNPSCGSTALTFDSYSTATVTVGVRTAGVAGKSAVLGVTVQSNGNGGGTASVTVGGKVYSGTIAAGQTTGTITVPTPSAGTFSYSNGSFVPALAGVASAPIANGTFTVAPAAVVKVNGSIKAVAPKAKHTKKAKVTVTVTASSAVPTGTVTVVVKKGTKTVVTVKNKTLAHGRAALTLPKKLKKGSYKVFVSYTGDA